MARDQVDRTCDHCGANIGDRRANARYCSAACRAYASDIRRGVRLDRVKAQSAPPRRSRRPDLRVSYRRLVPVLADRLNLDPNTVQQIIEPLLPPAAREHLEKGRS